MYQPKPGDKITAEIDGTLMQAVVTEATVTYEPTRLEQGVERWMPTRTVALGHFIGQALRCTIERDGAVIHEPEGGEK